MLSNDEKNCKFNDLTKGFTSYHTIKSKYFNDNEPVSPGFIGDYIPMNHFQL